MAKFFYFGEKVKGYDIRVLNEREVRASAGLLFFFAIIAFMNSWLTGNFYYTKIFVVVFLVDFIIRVLVNPKYAPSLIVGRLIVSNQETEYVGAPQKRFAWAIGLILAIIMFFVLVIYNIIGPTNMLICITCLILLFFEAAFGICIGCMIYNLFTGEKAELCPGGVCKQIKKEDIQKTNYTQILILLLFLAMIVFIFTSDFGKFHNLVIVSEQNSNVQGVFTNATFDTNTTTNCTVPDWAIAIGHVEMWKLHHGCS